MTRRVLVVSLLALTCFPLSVHAQTDATPPAAKVAVAPPEAREVIAEGRAAIGKGGILGAKKAAQAQALRNAVEKTTGVFVGARTLTQNYEMVRDQVVTRADGYATLKEVIRENVGTQEVSVTIRALVSLRPLAVQLKGLGLTRAWRIYVVSSGNGGGTPGSHARAATSTVENTLTEAGFVVVSQQKDADLMVRITPHFTTVSTLPLDTAAGPMTMNTVKGDIIVRATRTETGEVVCALSADDTALHISLATARDDATSGAMKTLAPRLAETLMVLPARGSQPVQLVVSRLMGIAQVSRIEDALNRVTGVQGVRRRTYASGRAVWELDVLSDALPSLSQSLEAGPLRFTVSADTGGKITARAPATAPTVPKTFIQKTARKSVR